MLKYLLKILLVVMTAFFFTACGSDDDDDNNGGNNNNGGGNPNVGPQTSVNYEVKLIGPGGHSNGAYGTVNALHAAARAVMALEADCNSAGIEFYVKEIHGGNSVNAIASDGYFTVGLVKGDAAAFKTIVENAAKKGMEDENDFRDVQTGATNAQGGRRDIRIDSITEMN